jgi:hypothetical protein
MGNSGATIGFYLLNCTTETGDISLNLDAFDIDAIKRGNAGAIVASILESAKALQKNTRHGLITGCCKNSTHGRLQFQGCVSGTGLAGSMPHLYH